MKTNRYHRILRRLKNFHRLVFRKAKPSTFTGSADYWECRYLQGGNSGAGSYNHLADYKASVINKFVSNNSINSVIEFGCGDGNQLSLLSIPDYLGVDVAPAAIELCKFKFSNDQSKRFCLLCDFSGATADLCMSLDVIYHLVEDSAFNSHMQTLFESARNTVIIYSSNFENNAALSDAQHVRHRIFTDWVNIYAPQWELFRTERNPYKLENDPENQSFADFYFYRKK